MLAERLTAAAARDCRGSSTPLVNPRDVHTYWKYCLRVDRAVIAGGADGLGRLLKERGIACAPRYIQKPAFQCEVFRDQRTFGDSRFPFTLARPEAVDYSPGACSPGRWPRWRRCSCCRGTKSPSRNTSNLWAT